MPGYCLPLFGACDVQEVKDLQILQNKAAQIVTHSPLRAERKTMYNKLGWLTVKQLILYHTLLTVYRVRQTGEPEYLASLLSRDSPNGRMIIQNTSLTLTKKSFSIRGACDWNYLPPSIRELKSLSQFKKEVKAWIKREIPRFLD